MKNQDVKQAITTKGFRLWQVADKLGIADNAFSRKLRHELPQDMKDRIFAIIDELEVEACK